MDSKDWTEKEFEMVDLGDDRLNQRLIKISQQILESPQSNINNACGDWSETKAAYRFFQNDNINYQDIIDAHAQMTKERAKQEETILAIQDTTYFNYTHHPKTEGLGVLTKSKGKHKDEILTLGLCMHTTLGITTEGLPLGILDQYIFSREELPKEKKELKNKSHNTALPIEEKESIRWLDSMRQTAARFEQENKRVVTIADREADIYDLFLLADRLKTNLLVRASQNRKINKTAIHSDISGERLWDFMKKQKLQGTIQVRVPQKEDRPERLAACNIKFGKINVLPSRHYKGSKEGNLNLDIYAIHIFEKRPPKGCRKMVPKNGVKPNLLTKAVRFVCFTTMARPLRIEYPGAWYHFTYRGNERNHIFKDDTNRKEFLKEKMQKANL